jgi:hypothetical protein
MSGYCPDCGNPWCCCNLANEEEAMSADEKKPREFWISITKTPQLMASDKPDMVVQNGLGENVEIEKVHVIEYSAYETLLATAKELLEELRPYSQGRRDQSSQDWQTNWKEVEIKNESDYEFYPNHVEKEVIEKFEAAIRGMK